MEDVILRISEYRPLVEDALDSLELLITDSHEIQLIIISLFFIVLISTMTIFERLRIKGWKCLIPFYGWYVLLKALGLNPWLSLLMYLPGINFIMFVVFYVRMARVFKFSYLLVPCLVFFPFIFMPIIAFTDGKCDHYQPHAQLVDLPSEPKLSPVVTTVKKQGVKKIRVPVTPIASTNIRKQIAKPVKRVSNVIRIQVQDTNGNKVAKRSIPEQARRVKSPKHGYLDIKPIPKSRSKTIPPKVVLQPKAVLDNPHGKLTHQKDQRIRKTQKRPIIAKPIPGDIRLMKSNVVVIGALSEPAPKVRRSPVKFSNNIMPVMHE